jgi:hypothetical protein
MKSKISVIVGSVLAVAITATGSVTATESMMIRESVAATESVTATESCNCIWPDPMQLPPQKRVAPTQLRAATVATAAISVLLIYWCLWSVRRSRRRRSNWRPLSTGITGL